MIDTNTAVFNKTKSLKDLAQQLSLEESLVALDLLTEAQVELAKIEARRRNRPLAVVLQEMNLITEEGLKKALARSFNLPYIDLKNKKIPLQTLQKISEPVARNYKIIAFEANDDGKKLKVAIEDPTNLKALEALEFIKEKNDYEIELYVASSASIQYALEQYKTINEEVGKALEEIAVDLNVDETVKEKIDSAEKMGSLIKDAPISKMVAVLVKYATEARASDIHIEPKENRLEIRYRIDGILHPVLNLPRSIHPAIVSRIKILSNLKIDETRLPQDGRFHTLVGGKKIDFRVSTLPTPYGEKVVLRLLDKTTGLIQLEQLGLVDRNLELVRENIKKPYGMILVCGPTGSGKTTTLYAVLQKINTPQINIVTLEDPIEYQIEGINQSQIRPELGYTFATGLRTLLRQDPDVIMVGEIRDNETAEMAVHAALTGHLVLSTLHTNDAAGAIPRLIDMGVEPFLIASSVVLIISQRLVRKLCPYCSYEYKPTPAEKIEIENEIKKLPPTLNLKISSNFSLRKSRGCEKCNGLGYSGRIGIFETIPMTEEIEKLTLQQAPASDIFEVARKEGMITMKQDGVLKVLAGITTLQEVLKVTKI